MTVPHDESAHLAADEQQGPPTDRAARPAPMPAWFYTFLPNKLGIGATVNLPPLFITEVLGASVAAVGVASALTSAATVPAAALWGWLSDRYGTRKRYLILGYLGFAIPTILTAYTTQVWQYMALALLLGAWSIAGAPVSSTLIMDTVPRHEWDETFGRFNAVNGWGVVGGRVFGLIWIAWGIAMLGNERAQRGLWLVAGCISLLSVLWAWFAVPQPRMSKPRPPRLHEPTVEHYTGTTLIDRVRFLPQSLYQMPVWRPRRFLGEAVPHSLRYLRRESAHWIRDPLLTYYLTTLVLFTVSVMAYTPFAVWQVQVLGNSAATVFLVGMVNSVASALSYRWVGRQIRRYGSLSVQMATISTRIVTFGGFAVVGWLGITGLPSIVILIALNLLSGLGWAGIAVAGNTTVAHLAPRGSEGAAVGAYTSFVSVGSIVGAFASGFVVLRFGYETVFVVGALGVIVSVALLALIKRTAPSGVHL